MNIFQEVTAVYKIKKYSYLRLKRDVSPAPNEQFILNVIYKELAAAAAAGVGGGWWKVAGGWLRAVGPRLRHDRRRVGVTRRLGVAAAGGGGGWGWRQTSDTGAD
jgi:hypothetical protein